MAPSLYIKDMHAKLPTLHYSMADVPNCRITSDGIEGSVVHLAFERELWEGVIEELWALCHEAAERRGNKTGAFHGIHHEHAEAERISLSFLQDRLETDDPIRGFFIRTEDEQQRLQGFIWYTTFTTWTHWFKWDSTAPRAGLKGSNRHGIRWDKSGELSAELEAQQRSGDPTQEGVIWPRVGEIAVMSGLECGGFLLQLVLEEMRSKGLYDYVVVQATESSAGFYDRMGFIRVGALAKYAKPGQDVMRSVSMAYRHFTGPADDVKEMDSSIMMAIRLTEAASPRRVLADHGGILANLGVKIPVSFQVKEKVDAPFFFSRSVKACSERNVVIGPRATRMQLQQLSEALGSSSSLNTCCIDGWSVKKSRRNVAGDVWMIPKAYRSWMFQRGSFPNFLSLTTKRCEENEDDGSSCLPQINQNSHNRTGMEMMPSGQVPWQDWHDDHVGTLTKKTLQLISSDLRLPLSTRGRMVAPILEESRKLASHACDRETPPLVLLKDKLKLDTLRCICCDLGLDEHGSMSVLKERIASYLSPSSPSPSSYPSSPASGSTDPWDDVACNVCRRRDGEERMILCDECDGGFHLECLQPKLEEIPKGRWLCLVCGEKKEKKRKVEKVSKEGTRSVGEETPVKCLSARKRIKPERYKPRMRA